MRQENGKAKTKKQVADELQLRINILDKEIESEQEKVKNIQDDVMKDRKNLDKVITYGFWTGSLERMRYEADTLREILRDLKGYPF